jgi:hypothetical protein
VRVKVKQIEEERTSGAEPKLVVSPFNWLLHHSTGCLNNEEKAVERFKAFVVVLVVLTTQHILNFFQTIYIRQPLLQTFNSRPRSKYNITPIAVTREGQLRNRRHSIGPIPAYPMVQLVRKDIMGCGAAKATKSEFQLRLFQPMPMHSSSATARSSYLLL